MRVVLAHLRISYTVPKPAVVSPQAPNVPEGAFDVTAFYRAGFRSSVHVDGSHASSHGLVKSQ